MARIGIQEDDFTASLTYRLTEYAFLAGSGLE
jgi:hypothetical protein